MCLSTPIGSAGFSIMQEEMNFQLSDSAIQEVIIKAIRKAGGGAYRLTISFNSPSCSKVKSDG